jgi:hypothetical protein
MNSSPSVRLINAVLPFPPSPPQCPELYAAAATLSRNLPEDLDGVYDMLMEVVLILLENKNQCLSAEDALLILFQREFENLAASIKRM